MDPDGVLVKEMMNQPLEFYAYDRTSRVVASAASDDFESELKRGDATEPEWYLASGWYKALRERHELLATLKSLLYCAEQDYPVGCPATAVQRDAMADAKAAIAAAEVGWI
jgi:hypothetical protein